VPVEAIAGPVDYPGGWAVQVIMRDITERQQAEAGLQRLAAIVESSEDAIIGKDLTGTITSWNAGAERLYGFTAAEAMGQPIALLMPPDGPDELPALLERVGRSERITDYETRRLRKDGTPLDVSLRLSPIKDQTGAIVGISTIARDITERQRMHHEQAVTVDFLRLVNESTGTRDLLRAATLFFHEQSGCAAVGVRLRDGDDYPYFEARGFPPEFLLAENRLCAYDHAGTVLRDSVGDPVLDCMCGNVIWGRVDPAQPFFTAHGSFWTNSTTRLLATTTDADRQARTRNRCNGEGYESVALLPLRVGPQRLGLLQLNDRRPGRFSPETIALWERLADHLAVAVAKCQAEEALRAAHDALEQRVAARTAELSRTLQQLAVQSGQLRSLASELTLVEQRERVRLAEQIHDGLQQLLVAVRLKVDLLGRGEDPTVRQNCQEIGRLLDEALADARSLTAELSPPILRTGGLLAGLEWLARWSQERHALTVHLTAPVAPLPPLPEDLTVLLFQSVRELLFNAVKYAQVPAATVTLAWDPPGLTLSVADAGTGFDPHGLRGEGGGGGGFGLARIRHRLELLGGCMTLASAPGQGTRVTLAVLLPPADQPAATSAPPQLMASPQPVPASAPGSPRPIRLLVVDDHQVVRRALAQLLRAEADLAVVGEASTGTAAVALAGQLVPDVVLMDINMPEMNGIEATRAIHAAFPAIRVIGLSMFDRGDQQVAMQAAGAVAYVCKSAPAEELLAAIRGG